MELIFSFFARLDRKAPGSEASTRRALSLLPPLPQQRETVEFGCGSGAATLVLAEATGGRVTAVDICQRFLADLAASASRAGVAERVRAVLADMAAPPFPDGSFDLVWSEAAIYLAGFEEGLSRWRPLLRSGGCIAVTEVTWLTGAPSPEARAFWAAEYPAISTIERNRATIRASGFEPLGEFVLPAADWRNYYEPLEKQIEPFRCEHAGSGEAESFLDDLRREIDLWQRFGDSYGYVFYLARVF